MIDSDAKAIIRTMRDVLQDARQYVYPLVSPTGRPEGDWRAEAAALTLERVDGAIAEADEVLT